MSAKGGCWRAAVRPIACVFLFGTLVGCTSPPNVSSDKTSMLHARYVPDGSLRVGEVVYIATRKEILKNPLVYDTLTIAAGVPDKDIRDGNIVTIRFFCCGGPDEFARAELWVYVPEGEKAEMGDIIEVWSGRMMVEGEVPSAPNTMTRRVQQANAPSHHCRWMPDNPRLWLRVIYCDWMPEEDWILQERSFGHNVWIKPIAASSPPLGN